MQNGANVSRKERCVRARRAKRFGAGRAWMSINKSSFTDGLSAGMPIVEGCGSKTVREMRIIKSIRKVQRCGKTWMIVGTLGTVGRVGLWKSIVDTLFLTFPD